MRSAGAPLPGEPRAGGSIGLQMRGRAQGWPLLRGVCLSTALDVRVTCLFPHDKELHLSGTKKAPAVPH